MTYSNNDDDGVACGSDGDSSGGDDKNDSDNDNDNDDVEMTEILLK